MSSKLRFVTANFSGKIRREIFNGREYWVAPVTMIVPGVLNGSRGPLLYPPKEAARNPEAWNYMPITDGHPTNSSGRPVSARSPDVLEQVGLGFVFHAQFPGKLRGEGWFDVERTRWVNPKVYDALRRGKPFELSTGLYTENELKRGIWNGRRYQGVARNYRPDHLAVLIDGVGACSLGDGCGVNVNKRGKKKRKKALALASARGSYNELMEDALEQLRLGIESLELAVNSNEEDDGVNYEDDVEELVDELSEEEDEEDELSSDFDVDDDYIDDEDSLEDILDEDEDEEDYDDDDGILDEEWEEVGDEDDDDFEDDEEEAA